MPMPPRAGPPDRVPTLTEVLDPPAPGDGLSGNEPAAAPAPSTATDRPEVHRAQQNAEVAERLMADLQHHLDRVTDARVAAVVEPLLEEMSARLLQQVREELASSLHEAMASALARELSRHRGEPWPR